MIPSLSIGPRTLLNVCNHSATANVWRSAILLRAWSGRIGSASSQLRLAIRTSKVTHAIWGSLEHCSAILCHSMLWLDVTLQLVMYSDMIFDVIACS